MCSKSRLLINNFKTHVISHNYATREIDCSNKHAWIITSMVYVISRAFLAALTVKSLIKLIDMHLKITVY